MSLRIILALLATVSAAPGQAEDVVVFAAASLKTALDTVAADFQSTTGDTVTVSYAGSNALAKQIVDGAPADIFLSASEPWMDEVEKAGVVVAGTRRDLLGNRLVLVAHDLEMRELTIDGGLNLPELLGGSKLAMAMVDSVPAGQYGKEALSGLGLWTSVEPHVAQTENVRAALALVASGEAPFGIVYASDAVAEPGVKVVGNFPAESHAPIVYPAALLTTGNASAAKFLQALSSDRADATFAAQGFIVID